MSETTQDDTIRIEEAGLLFEVFGAMVEGIEVADLDAAGRAVDQWLDERRADDPHRFGGYSVQV